MGAVYAAEDTELGNRLVAVKEMSQHNLSSPQEITNAAEHFKQEAHLLAKLQSSHLPSIHDYFTETGRWYLVMSFIQGETLQRYLARNGGKLPVEEVLQIGITLCSVLEYLHSQRPPIIFRDLKPTNIMRTPDGQLFLIDFGIARHFKPGQARDTAIFGSAGYAAPEQYGRSQTTPRSDIYSLGAILYQLLSGRQPSLSPFNFPPLHSLGLALPPDLEALVQRMLSMDEDTRPQSMLAVKQELQRLAVPAAFAPTAFNPPSPPAGKPTPVPTRVAPIAGFNNWLRKQNFKQASINDWLKKQNPLNQANLNAWIGRQKSFKPSPARAQVAALPAKQARWSASRRLVVATIVGIVLCGLVTLWLDHGTFPTWFSFVVGNVPFRVSLFLVLDMVTLVIAIFCGAQLGPWSGLLVGGIGTLFGDYIGFAGGRFGWNWDLRVALVGFLVGWLVMQAKSRFKPARASLYGYSALAILIGTGFASYADLWLHQETLAVATVIFLVYSAISIVACLLLLSAFSRIYYESKKSAHSH